MFEHFHHLSVDRKLDLIMAAIDDLNSGITALDTVASAVEQAVTDLVAAVAAGANTNDPAIEAAVANINNVVAALKTSAALDPNAAPTLPAPDPAAPSSPTVSPAPAAPDASATPAASTPVDPSAPNG